jgi:hypothetical protein
MAFLLVNVRTHTPKCSCMFQWKLGFTFLDLSSFFKSYFFITAHAVRILNYLKRRTPQKGEEIKRLLEKEWFD